MGIYDPFLPSTSDNINNAITPNICVPDSCELLRSHYSGNIFKALPELVAGVVPTDPPVEESALDIYRRQINHLMDCIERLLSNLQGQIATINGMIGELRGNAFQLNRLLPPNVEQEKETDDSSDEMEEP